MGLVCRQEHHHAQVLASIDPGRAAGAGARLLHPQVTRLASHYLLPSLACDEHPCKLFSKKSHSGRAG